MTKEAIFHYVYGVLQDPIYREKYAVNLKREFPRIPFYPDFWKWADWGRKLTELHIGYETVKPSPLQAHRRPGPEVARKAASSKADTQGGQGGRSHHKLDSETQLARRAAGGWDYKLDNRSALEWVLDQYKERTPRTRPSAKSSIPTASPITRRR